MKDVKKCAQHINHKAAVAARIARQQLAAKERETQYYLNPKLCITCTAPIEYAKRLNKFCCASCAAKYNNVRKPPQQKDVVAKRVAKGLQTKRNKHIAYTKVTQCKVCDAWFAYNRSKIKTCSAQCKSKVLSINAINRKLGGNRNSHAHGYYTSKYAGTVYLESSYEYRVAVDLDNNNIVWIRPSPLYYLDESSTLRRYYADFYLIEYDVYLDPKNDYLIQQDMFKIKAVEDYNNVRVIVLNKNQLSWNYIQSVVS
jgi:hypothetical protein